MANGAGSGAAASDLIDSIRRQFVCRSLATAARLSAAPDTAKHDNEVRWAATTSL